MYICLWSRYPLSIQHTVHLWYWNKLCYSLLSSGGNSAHFLQRCSKLLQFSFFFHSVRHITAGWIGDSMEWEVCPTFLHGQHLGRTPDLLILSPTIHPFWHITLTLTPTPFPSRIYVKQVHSENADLLGQGSSLFQYCPDSGSGESAWWSRSLDKFNKLLIISLQSYCSRIADSGKQCINKHIR